MQRYGTHGLSRQGRRSSRTNNIAETFAAIHPSLPLGLLSCLVAYDTEQPLNVYSYFACIYANAIQDDTNARSPQLVYKGPHGNTVDEAVAAMHSGLRAELGDKVRSTLARRTPGMRREVWKGKFDLTAELSAMQIQNDAVAAEVANVGAPSAEVSGDRPPAYGT